ncbi:30S ribosomal protein S12 methylthiotransferase RimO [uncultured Clostridium sp.]|uniref:30S ribosomal protein S12 methylthiotransferase RimO n=1 Tax=uncultured Clostridium sp. TaxID=59620 RepID=UPI0026716B40|nr:30S ribosomal protein S12 methylthiotransferase RimO [uncultured Clostridium sp.]
MSKFKVGMVSLGCDKNRVDSELILGSINKFYEITNNPKEAEIIIINTCGFIESAKQESIDTILEMAEYKKTHKCKMIIATGCLTQRYGDELLELIPEIDILMGVNDYMKLHKLIVDFIKTEQRVSSTTYKDEGVNEGERILTTNSHTAYLRIAEGCNNFCTYCIIPKIRGKFRSRSKESILAEATSLVNQGVKEIILIAQDLTNYGEDLYGKNELHVLINEISNIKGLEWIRLLYCYPEEITDELIEVIANNPKVMKYLDLPIQHISNNILKMMARKTNKETIIGKINLLREKVPGITLRTSLIVGFPGETEEDFNELCRFLKNYKLDNVGVFTYSQEEGTAAAKLPNQVDEDVKIKRKEKLMSIQRGIVKDLNKLKIGNIYDTIIDGSTGEYYIGRNYEMAPEIDGLIYITKGKVLKKGDIIKVKITNIMEYDLVGDVWNESSK